MRDEGEVARVVVRTWEDGGWVEREDVVAGESPLELKLTHVHRGVRITRSVALTMRTPGHDADLVRGLLRTERIIEAREDIADVELRGLVLTVDVGDSRFEVLVDGRLAAELALNADVGGLVLDLHDLEIERLDKHTALVCPVREQAIDEFLKSHEKSGS